jgi:hypothetical protein
MLLIFFSWLYVVFTTINFGVFCDRLLVLKNKNFIITSFLGLFSITIVASIWAIFGRINIEFHILLLLLNLLLFLKFKVVIGDLYLFFWNTIRQLSTSLKVYLLLVTFMILAQCSMLPYVIDNESSCVQTIKWFNEYGFVKGLANLHLYLGQASGWHITQSVFNFSFIYPNFNDLSGYCLLLGMIFSIQKLNEYYKNNNVAFLLAGVFPLANLYFFQFIAAPSPDIAIYVLSFIVLFYFIENFKNCTTETFNLIVILVLYMLYIKSTSIVFALVPIILIAKNYSLFKKLLVPTGLALLILALFAIKNTIVSGSIFFPSKTIGFFSTDYSLPKTIETHNYNMIQPLGYNVSANEFQSMSFYELFLNWLSMPKLNGVFNKLCILIVCITPVFIYKFQNKKEYWLAYSLMLLDLGLLLATSPQFRFFANFLLLFEVFCFICIVRNNRIITSMLYLSILPVLVLSFIPIKLERFTNNPFMSQMSFYTFSALLVPLENSKIKTDFKVIEMGNLKNNLPVENDFFYGAGTGDLPSVHKTQMDYYCKNFKGIPQMGANNLKDGFYSTKITENEQI